VGAIEGEDFGFQRRFGPMRVSAGSDSALSRWRKQKSLLSFDSRL
jgi:hypothetical protein